MSYNKEILAIILLFYLLSLILFGVGLPCSQVSTNLPLSGQSQHSFYHQRYVKRRGNKQHLSFIQPHGIGDLRNGANNLRRRDNPKIFFVNRQQIKRFIHYDSLVAASFISLSSTESYSFLDSMNFVLPFSLLYTFVDPSLVFDLIQRNAFDILVTVKDATATSDFANLIAVGVAESSSGVVGGALSGALVKAVGNEEKQNSIQTRLSTSGIFFGTRGTVRATVRLLGLPYPIGLVLATLVGSTISQVVKILADQERLKLTEKKIEPEVKLNEELIPRDNKKKRKELQTANSLEVAQEVGIERSPNRFLKTLILFEKIDQNTPVSKSTNFTGNTIVEAPTGLSVPEITGDILKWILFDYLTNEFQEYLFVPPKTEFLFYFFIGAVAGGLGKGVEEILSSTAYLFIPNGKKIKLGQKINVEERKLKEGDNRNEKSVFRNILLSMMESGVLFSSYRLSLYLFNSVIPEDLNKQLYFELLYRRFIENYT